MAWRVSWISIVGLLIGLAAGAQSADVPESPDDGGPLVFEVTGVSTALNLRAEASTSADVAATLAPGALVDNLGCEAVEGRVWCFVQRFGGGPVGFAAAEYLKPATTPDGSPALGPDDSALRAGEGDFDATGQVPCAQAEGQPMSRCDFGVARAGGGFATVVVTRPDGMKRAIFFRLGRAIGADTSQADNPGEFSARREGDVTFVSIGPERYEIPDAVIYGG